MASSTTETLDQERVEFMQAFDESVSVAGWPEICTATVALVAWFVLFTGGTMIATDPYRSAVANGGLDSTTLFSWFMTMMFWTITNVGMLSILAALLGVFSQRTRFARMASHRLTQSSERPKTGASVSAPRVHVLYASAMMRGFGVYALALSGLLVFATDALLDPSQGQYVRLAGMISVVSFYAGYDPEVLAGLLERIRTFLQGNTGSDS